MANRSKKQLRNEAESILQYRWEFTRRSKGYRQDYTKYLHASNDEKRKKIWATMLEEYGFSPADYTLGYEKLKCIAERAYGDPYFATRVPPPKSDKVREAFLFISHTNFREPIVRTDGWSRSNLNEALDAIKFESMNVESMLEFRKMKSLRLIIDTTAPKERILQQLITILDIYQRIARYNIMKDETKKRFDHYNQYLTVYDLYNQGWSTDKIAKKLYKNDIVNDRIDYANKKVKRDYERCKKMIDGGSRQIR